MWSNRALERAPDPPQRRLGFSAHETDRPPALRREPEAREAEQHHRPGRELGNGGGVGRVDRRGRLWRRRVDYWRRRVEYRGVGKVARNLAGSAEKNSGHITKKHLTKGNVACVEASPRARLGRRKPQRERIAALLEASIIPTDGLTDRDTLWLKTGRPWTLILMDFIVSSAKLLLKSKLTVPVNGTRGPTKLPKLPDRWNVSTMSAFAPGAAIRASAATAVVDASRPAHEGSDLCPPASAPNCFISAPTQPPEGTGLRPLAPTPLTTRRLQLNITRRNFFVIQITQRVARITQVTAADAIETRSSSETVQRGARAPKARGGERGSLSPR